MIGSCALIGKGGSAFFPFLPCLGESETPIAGGKSGNVKGLRKKSAQVIYPLARHRISNQSPRNT